MVDSKCPVKGNEASCSGDMFHFDLYKNAFNDQLVRIGRLLARVEQDGTKKRTVTIKNLAPGTYKIAVNAYSKYYVYFGDVMPKFTEEDGHEDAPGDRP